MSERTTWGKETSPFHSGEREIHRRYGIYESHTETAMNIYRQDMAEDHQAFLATLEYVILGSVDSSGRPWASMVFGPPGFASASSAKTIQVRAQPLPGDRLRHNMVAGSPMSLLGVELATRKRIRANLTFDKALTPGLQLHIDQAYGNCPKYIQARTLIRSPTPTDRGEVRVESFSTLPDNAKRLIRDADTFFVASYNDRDDQHDIGGVDVNHRGGRPGFVRIDGDTLTIPDYAGNFAFNTLGNFLINPVAGLLFVDFESGDVLQLTGTSKILWEDDERLAGFVGAKRGWTFTVEEGTMAYGASDAIWEFDSFAQSSLRTGTWDDVDDVQ